MVYHTLNIISKDNLLTADIYCKENNGMKRYHLIISLGSNIIYEIHHNRNGTYFNGRVDFQALMNLLNLHFENPVDLIRYYDQQINIETGGYRNLIEYQQIQDFIGIMEERN